MAPGNPNITCSFPYASKYNCTVTFAADMGDPYTNLTIIWGIVVGITWVYSLFNVVAYSATKGYSLKLIQPLALYCSLAITSLLLIRDADLFGWRGIQPLVFNVLVTDLTGYICIHMSIIQMMTWFRFLGTATFRQRKKLRYRVFYWGSSMSVLFTIVTFGLVSTTVGPFKTFHVIKLIPLAVVLLVWSVFGTWYGYGIFKVLRETEKRYRRESSGDSSTSSRKDSLSGGISSSNTEDDRAGGSAHAVDSLAVEAFADASHSSFTSEQGGRKASKSLKRAPGIGGASGSTPRDDAKERSLTDAEKAVALKRIRSVRRVYRLLIVISLVEFVAMLGIIYDMVTIATDEFNPLTDPADSATPMMMVSGFVYEIVHWAVALICVSFYGVGIQELRSKPADAISVASSARPSVSSYRDPPPEHERMEMVAVKVDP